MFFLLSHILNWDSDGSPSIEMSVSCPRDGGHCFFTLPKWVIWRMLLSSSCSLLLLTKPFGDVPFTRHLLALLPRERKYLFCHSFWIFLEDFLNQLDWLGQRSDFKDIARGRQQRWAPILLTTQRALRQSTYWRHAPPSSHVQGNKMIGKWSLQFWRISV